MVITLTVANESNKDFSYHGQDRYFLSQGKTIESANKNMYECTLADISGIIDLTEVFEWILIYYAVSRIMY